ncbi:hypothetical protein IFM89_006606 [Coptis chinensis]|uniref:Uncharacterized protein n=1 Tax=Coptis chinensis TaxID=261450 RepID=A0A835IAL1_9MAGN|nr:hypothetical protein IFM89_006606 [Coptis chinensis]
MRMEQIIRFAINTYGNFASVLLRDSDRVVCVLQMIPVATNDVAFSIHAILLIGITLIPVLIYDYNTSLHDSHQIHSPGHHVSRKSTIGWSIGNILLDLLEGMTNYRQMAMQSIDQGSWVNFNGNIGKTLLSLRNTLHDALVEVKWILGRQTGWVVEQ